MFLHRFADLTISSTVPLAELPTSRQGLGNEADLTFSLMTASPLEPGAAEWAHHWRGEDGLVSLSLAKHRGKLLLRFPGMADFVVSANRRRIGAWCEPDTNTDSMRHLLLDQVLPRVLAHLGRLVVHASTVQIGKRCVAFLGESGAGKSTLASSFHATDSSLLADDGVVLSPGEEGVLATPTYRSLRVWPDTVAGVFQDTPAVVPMAQYSAKRRVVMPEGRVGAADRIPLSALYILAPGAGSAPRAITTTKLSPRDACMAILANSFQMDVTDRRRAAETFAAAGDIAERIPAFELSYPRDFKALAAVRSAIAHHDAT